MSKQRMDDVLEALERRGWRLEQDADEASADPFVLEEEQITWVVYRPGRTDSIVLEFHAFGDLGQHTTSLSDVLYCRRADKPDQKLFFSKRKTQDWKKELVKFVDSFE